MLVELSRSYPSREGTPVLARVDTTIFTRTYYSLCLSCSFCNDWCCSDGVDIGYEEVRRLDRYAVELESYTGVPRDRWFTDETYADEEYPGHGCTRTNATARGCVFLNPVGRGCMLHSFCLLKGIDYHELKPLTSCLFPVTFDGGTLWPAPEADDSSLVCLGHSQTLYQGTRGELLHYFGPEFIAELDTLAGRTALP